jgi:diguanylate cyclase (GGDEF)-like protein
VGGAKNSYHLASPNRSAYDLTGTPEQLGKFAKEAGRDGAAEVFYDPVGGFKKGKSIGAVGNHKDHAHIAFDEADNDLRVNLADIEPDDVASPGNAAANLVNELTAANPSSRLPAPAKVGMKGAGENQLGMAVSAANLPERVRKQTGTAPKPMAKAASKAPAAYSPSAAEQQLQRYFEEYKAQGNLPEANKYANELKAKYGWSMGSMRAPTADGSLFGVEWPYIKPPGSQGVENKVGQGTESFINQGVANREAAERRQRIKAQQDARRKSQGFVANAGGAVKDAAEGAMLGAGAWAGDRVAGAGRLLETVTDAMRPPQAGVSSPSISGRDARPGESIKEAGEKAATASRDYLADFGQSLPSQGGALVGELAPDLVVSALTGAPVATFGTSTGLSAYGQGKPLGESILTGIINAGGMKGGNILAAELEQLAKGEFGKYVARSVAQGVQNVATNTAIGGEVPITPQAAARELLFALGFGVFPTGHPKAAEANRAIADIAAHPETHPQVATEIGKVINEQGIKSASVQNEVVPTSAKDTLAAQSILPLPETQPMVEAQGEPPIAAGHIRVYRGEGDLPAGSGSRNPEDAGRWFTNNKAMAEDFAEQARTGEKAAPLRYVDLPIDEAEKLMRRGGGDNKSNEYILSDEYLNQATPIENVAAKISQSDADAALQAFKNKRIKSTSPVENEGVKVDLNEEGAKGKPIVVSLDEIAPITEGEVVGESPQSTPTAKKLINERRKAERERDTDVMTGLQSQGAYVRAKDAIDADPNRAVVAIDLNSFKAVNDTYGHPAGDRVLANYAKELQKAVPNAQMLARSGGDEMVVIVDPKDAEAATQIIRKIKVKEGDIEVTGSVGHGMTDAEADIASKAHKEELKAAGLIGRERGDAPPKQAEMSAPEFYQNRFGDEYKRREEYFSDYFKVKKDTPRFDKDGIELIDGFNNFTPDGERRIVSPILKKHGFSKESLEDFEGRLSAASRDYLQYQSGLNQTQEAPLIKPTPKGSYSLGDVSRNADGTENYHITDNATGKRVTRILVSYNKSTKDLTVVSVGEYGKSSLKNQFGHKVVKSLFNELELKYPEARTIGGLRVSGARPVEKHVSVPVRAKAARKTIPSGTDIIQAIRDKGGIDMGSLKGEQKRLRESKLRQPGVFNSARDKNGNRKGMAFDEMARELYSDGYLTDSDERNQVNEMFAKLDDAAMGKRILSIYDEGAAIEQQKAIDDEWDSFGTMEDIDEADKQAYTVAVEAAASKRLNDAVERIEKEGADEGAIQQLEDVARYEVGLDEDQIQDLISSAKSRYQATAARHAQEGQGKTAEDTPANSPGQRQSDVSQRLTTTEIDRVKEIHKSLKEQGIKADEYLRRGDLFNSLSPEQQDLLREMEVKAQKAKPTAEQDAMFDTSPTVESRQSAPEPERRVEGGLFSGWGEKNTGTTKAEAKEIQAKLKENLEKKRGSGPLDTEDIIHLSKLAAYHIEAGAREFGDFSQRMVEQLGEFADEVKPYLRQLFDEYHAKNAAPTHHSQNQPRDEEGKFVEAEKAQAERSLPKTLEGEGLEKGSNLLYDIVGNDEAIATAKANLSSKGVDGAAEFVRTSTDPSAETTATGIAAIAEYQKKGMIEKANELASDLSAMLTRAGQSIQAVKLIAQFSPERALITAQKIAEKNKQKVSDLRARGITKSATKMQALEAQIKELEAIISDFEKKAKAKETSRRAKVIKQLDEAEASARQRLGALNIAPRPVRTSPTQQGAVSLKKTNASPETINDLAAVVAAKIAKADTDLAGIRQSLSTEFGNIFDANYRQIERKADSIIRELNQQQSARPSTPRQQLKKAVIESDKWDRGIKDAAKENPSDMGAVGASLLADVQSKGSGRGAWIKQMQEKFGDEFKKNEASLYKQAFESVKEAKKFHSDFAAILQAHREGAVTPEQIQIVQKRLDAARKAHRDANLELARHYDALSGGRRLRLISDWRKAGLLSSVRTHAKNFISNTAYQVFDEFSRVPAVVADFVASTATGQRSITGFSPSASLDGVVAAFKVGGPEAKNIIITGVTPDEAAKLQIPQESNSGIKIIDTATNAVFRAMGASDRLFYNGALRRNLLDRAKVQALNEAREGKIKFGDVKDRAKKLTDSPSDQLLTGAKHDALVATFNNSNKLSDKIRLLRSGMSPGANFALDLVMPFDRTPTNVIARVLESSPAGFVKASRIAAKSVMNKAMSVEEQRQFSQTFGRATLGTGLMTLGWVLGSKGLMSAMYDEDDDWESRKENRKNKEQGKSPMALKVGSQWVSIGDTNVGNLLAIGATLQKEMGEAKDTTGKVIAPLKTAFNVLSEQPLLGSAKDLFKAGSDPQGKGANYAGRLASSFIPASAMVRDAATASDSKARKTFGFKGQLMAPIPGLRNKLPEDVGVQHRRSWAVDPFRMATDKKKSGGYFQNR